MTEQEFYIGQTFETLYPPEAADWCNKNNAIIADLEDGGFKIVAAPELTKEEVAETRRQLYIAQKDPITCQIQALRDEEQTEEIIAEIEALKVERAAIVEKIKSENPYPETIEAANNLLGDTQNETISEENSTNSFTETTDLMV